MEESFETLQQLLAIRLFKDVQIEHGNLAITAKKKEPPISTDDALVNREAQGLTEPDFVRIEKNIASFGFFTPSSKRIKNVPKVIEFTQIVDGNKVEARVKISGNVEHGMPITADQDKYLAFQKIIERNRLENGTVSNPITFTTAELLTLLGTSKNGNRYKEVEEWLDVMNSTYIKSEGAVWLKGKKRFASDSFVIFQRVRRMGQELDDGSLADKNYVWLSEWYLENLNNFYLLPIDFDTYKQLKNNIAKALTPLLQVWLYASREVGSFEKRYSDICQVLNIAQYKHLSTIKQKFSPSLDELQDHGYLSSWTINKTADKKDFKITFKHGSKFYLDREKRIRKRRKAQNGSQLTLVVGKATRQPESENRRTVRQPEANTAKFSQQPDVALDNMLDSLSDEARELARQLHIDYQINPQKAVELVTSHPEESRKQLEAFPYRNTEFTNSAGFLIGAIEKKYSLPGPYLQILRRREADQEKENQKAIWAEEARVFQEAIDECQFCDEEGRRYIKHGDDSSYKAMHFCTHNEDAELCFEDWTKNVDDPLCQ